MASDESVTTIRAGSEGRGMMLTTDPPVNVSSSVNAVRDWIVELMDLRERYRDDHEALRRITGDELYANRLLDLIAIVPKVAAPGAT